MDITVLTEHALNAIFKVDLVTPMHLLAKLALEFTEQTALPASLDTLKLPQLHGVAKLALETAPTAQHLDQASVILVLKAGG